MLAHYFRHAVRLLAKQRLYAAINVTGLAVAIGLCVLIALYVKGELTFDHWHENADRVYRVDRIDYNPDGNIQDYNESQPFIFGPSLARDHVGVEAVVRFSDTDVTLRQEGALHEVEALFADPDFFRLFSYTAVRGNLDAALDDLESVVFTRSEAERVFGTVDVVGRTIEVRFEDAYLGAEVTAVVEDPPPNTHLNFGALFAFERTPMVFAWIANRTDTWRASSFPTWVLLREGFSPELAQERLVELRHQYYPGFADEARAAGWWTGEGEPSMYGMIPLKELHLLTVSNPRYSWILGGIGLLILVLACINFTLLTLGRSTTRAAEIGVRKAIGAGRWEIVSQFGGESVLMSVLGFAGGLALAATFLPAAEALSERQLGLWQNPDVIVMMALVALTAGVLAGFYPSAVISRHRPTEALRGRFSLGGTSVLSRSLLMVQFVASIVLVAGALVMQDQLRFMGQWDKGYDANNVVVVSANRTDGHALTRHLKATLGTRAGVTGITSVSLSMNRGYSSSSWMADGVERRAYIYNVDADFPATLGMELIAGRAFDASRPADSLGAVMVNEAFARDWGWSPSQAIGQTVTSYRGEPTIIGVLRDMNFRSLHEQVDPMMLTMGPGFMGYTLVKVAPGRTADVLEALAADWKTFAADIPLSYTFLDEDVALAYREDVRWSRMVGFAAGIAILVACMGLFGLAALVVSRRTKEIGIRKVLGASVGQVTALISREFALLVVFATLVAGPLAYVALSRWLDSFAYHIELSVWMFVLAGLAVLAVAMTTVGFHAVRAAVSDPVQALRYD